MNMTMKSALSAIALAAGMLAGAAHASPVVTNYAQQNIATNLTAHVESLFDDPTGSSYGFTINLVSAVPEPEAYALMLAGLGMMGMMGVTRRRKRPN